MRTTAGRSSRRSRISSSARSRPVEIRVPAPNVSGPRASGRIGQPSPCPRRDTEEAHERPQLGGGSARRQCHIGGVREEDEPNWPFESASWSSVARIRSYVSDEMLAETSARRSPSCQRVRRRWWSGRSEARRRGARRPLRAPRRARSAGRCGPARGPPKARLASESGMALEVLTAARSRRDGQGRRPPLRQVVDATRRHGRRSWRPSPRAPSRPARGAPPPAGGPLGRPCDSRRSRTARSYSSLRAGGTRAAAEPRRDEDDGDQDEQRRAACGESGEDARPRREARGGSRSAADTRARGPRRRPRGRAARRRSTPPPRSSRPPSTTRAAGSATTRFLARHAPGAEAGEPLREAHLAPVALDRGRPDRREGADRGDDARRPRLVLRVEGGADDVVEGPADRRLGRRHLGADRRGAERGRRQQKPETAEDGDDPDHAAARRALRRRTAQR